MECKSLNPPENFSKHLYKTLAIFSRKLVNKLPGPIWSKRIQEDPKENVRLRDSRRNLKRLVLNSRASGILEKSSCEKNPSRSHEFTSKFLENSRKEHLQLFLFIQSWSIKSDHFFKIDNDAQIRCSKFGRFVSSFFK